MARPGSKNSRNNSTANLGFEAKLWLAADKLRNKDAAFGLRPVFANLRFNPALRGTNFACRFIRHVNSPFGIRLASRPTACPASSPSVSRFG